MRSPADAKQFARRLSQGVFLLLFFILFIKTDYDGRNELAYPVKIFLDADLLVFLTSLLSAHTLPASLFLALLFVPVTLLFGRAFCGWVCPLGTLLHAVSFFDRKFSPERGVNHARAELDIEETDPSRLICSSKMVLGNGRLEDIHDIVVVDFNRFDRGRSQDAAHEVAS